MSEEEKSPLVIQLSDRIVAWVLTITALATLGFFSWIGLSIVSLQNSIGHLGEQITSIREQRSEAAGIVVERLNYLSARVERLEVQVERLRHPGDK